MTTYAAALENIRTEIATTIKAIVPDKHVQARSNFSQYITSQSSKPIREFTGRSRKFYVDFPASSDGFLYCGKSLASFVRVLPLIIVYRSNDDWMIAAQSDIQKIRDVLLETSGSHGVAGVQNRHVALDAAIPKTKQPGDDWEYYEIPISVWFEVERA